MNSSISSSDGQRWRRFFAILVGAAVTIGAVLIAAVAIVDPFDTLALSPNLDRVPIATNARYSFPALARSSRFDSVVIGTSTSRLLRPERLNALFGGRFANLAMNSATAYEQTQMLSLFGRSHATPATVMIGIDTVWCDVGTRFERFTPRPFPTWMYDDNPWNDLPAHFNLYSLEQAGRQFATMIGLRPVKYGRDGYTNFLPAAADYDNEKARRNLWGDGPDHVVPVTPAQILSDEARAALRFPTHGLMQSVLAELPPETRKILFFVPTHVSAQPQPGSRGAAEWQECKARMVAMAADVENATVVDFMLPSPVTATDRNYWDRLHYTVEIADLLAEDLYVAAQREGDSGGRFRLLSGPAEDGAGGQ